tara:strand:- start:534 stop:674 length:141 start_codon:yes stop_codon:yes gene_type:complete
MKIINTYSEASFFDLKYLLIIWGVVLLICILEAYFCTETADDDFEN